ASAAKPRTSSCRPVTESPASASIRTCIASRTSGATCEPKIPRKPRRRCARNCRDATGTNTTTCSYRSGRRSAGPHHRVAANVRLRRCARKSVSCAGAEHPHAFARTLVRRTSHTRICDQSAQTSAITVKIIDDDVVRVQARSGGFSAGGVMRIAQIAPLYESVPPKYYGGTERVVSYLTEELVRQGHDVTLFASGDSLTSAQLVPCCPRSLRLDQDCVDQMAHHVLALEHVMQRADDFDVLHFHADYFHYPLSRRAGYVHVTTLHGRLDTPDLAPLYREFRDMPLVSISDAQRKPL